MACSGLGIDLLALVMTLGLWLSQADSMATPLQVIINTIQIMTNHKADRLLLGRQAIFPDPPESLESNRIPVIRGISHYLFYYTTIMVVLS